jgi:transposase InsO family protein
MCLPGSWLYVATSALNALEMALQQGSVPVGLLHHSDRGTQYGAMAYQ